MKNPFEIPSGNKQEAGDTPDWLREELERRRQKQPLPREGKMEKSGGAPSYVTEEIERRKRTEAITQRLENLRLRAKENPRAPFVLVKGRGFFEVPVWVMVELSNVDLGFPMGLDAARKAFKYLGEQGIINTEPHKEWPLVRWAGSAKEAVEMVEKKTPSRTEHDETT